MTEIFNQRKTELEIAAKNTIVEMHLIKAKADEIASMIETREKQLDNINAAIGELDHVERLITSEESRQEAQVLDAAKVTSKNEPKKPKRK